MRMHLQYANLATDINGAAFNPPATDHFFLRRMYLTLKAGLGANWDAIVTFDFAGQSYDDANIGWKPTNDLQFYFGLRKVEVCYEERASSGNIKSIERSSVTRYFVESNNGRRLGAGSYRIGAFLNGKRELSNALTLIYTGAATGPERNETWTGSAGFGDNTNNHVALWGTAGLSGKLANGTWYAGVGSGWLPDQGGFGTANLGRGFDLNVYDAVTDITVGRFGLMAEYLTAEVERGRGTPGNGDALPRGFFIQPSLLLTDTIEAVVRYAWLDSDRRGVTLSDVVRSAPSGGTMDKFTEWYAGVNWYLKGNDLKYQLGAVYGKTRDTLTGAPADAKAVGVRSQLQMQF
jgi:phosphate-selective porin